MLFPAPPTSRTRPLLVVAAGGGRCGSTWQYNVLRILLQRYHRDGSLLEAGYVGKVADAPLLANAARVIVTIRRDLRDAVASMMVQGVMPHRTLAEVHRWATMLVMHTNAWSVPAALIDQYVHIVRDRERAVLRLARVLGLTLSLEHAREVAAEVDRIAIEPGNAQNLIQPNHRTGVGVGGYRQILKPEMADHLLQHFPSWCTIGVA